MIINKLDYVVSIRPLLKVLPYIFHCSLYFFQICSSVCLGQAFPVQFILMSVSQDGAFPVFPQGRHLALPTNIKFSSKGLPVTINTLAYLTHS
jgi:hypothetical protein